MTHHYAFCNSQINGCLKLSIQPESYEHVIFALSHVKPEKKTKMILKKILMICVYSDKEIFQTLQEQYTQLTLVVLSRAHNSVSIIIDCDALSVESAPDGLTGESAPDALSGERAPDALSGESAPDTLSEESAPDTLSGESAPDTLSGESAPDTLLGERAPDALSGERAPDTLSGERAPDALSGESAPDALSGESAPDALSKWSIEIRPSIVLGRLISLPYCAEITDAHPCTAPLSGRVRREADDPEWPRHGAWPLTSRDELCDLSEWPMSDLTK